MDAAARGSTALSEKDFVAAVKHYTSAIATNPQAVDYYIKRSTAYIRQSPSNPLLALLDAETAVVLAHKRGKRELIAQGQLRRGIALFTSERYADAGRCFEWVKTLNPNEKTLAIWDAKIQSKLADLGEDDEKRQIKVKEMPEIDVDEAANAAKASKEAEAQSSQQKKENVPPTTTSEPRPQGVQTTASKIRHDWYQSAENVTVSLMVKGVPKDKTVIEILPGSLSISFPLSTGSDFNFSLDPLFAKIDVSASGYKVMSTKVEFTLRKVTPGQKWPSLEGTEPIKDSGTTSTTTDHQTINAKSSTGVPAYPTSSKSGPKNWDKLASDLTKKPSSEDSKKSSTMNDDKGDKAEGEDEDEAYGSDDGGDPVNGFFKKLYKNADPDMQRAMMKSYQESNGTALSTNWKEVGKGKVETTPPEGMVAKKWGD